ncbi:tetratricopeptide repeat protein [Pseudopedobacter beijingensis]|uniref:Tetratricopeptide repeat protein n=1 Tax=Pseudopedobacter beijingensis TaxID=1207056 RepID=A0ABW4IB09_9SPHI
MNITKKIAITAIGIVSMGTASWAQSLEDARNAVTAEQYQKAKSMFNNLITTQPNVASNYFYFGDLYLRLENADSAKVLFQKGIGADPGYRLNYIGLGTVDLFSKNETAAQANFDKALSGMKKKDYQEYIHIGNAYVYEKSRDLDKAFEWYEKAKAYGSKDPELYIALGNAYKMQKKNSEAVAEYQRASNYKADLPNVDVAIGEIWTGAYNFELAETTLKEVISKHPSFGPAYRAMAENYYRWASQIPAKRPELLPKAKEQYSKYLDLTDRSANSRYRYLIFLLNAEDYATLETEAKNFVSKHGSNPEYKLAERFLAYGAIENGNTEVGAQALQKFISSVDKKRLIAKDYINLAKAYQDQKQDSLAIESYIKGYELDTSNVELLGNIAKAYFSSKKYGKAAEYYEKLTKLPKASFTDWFYWGYSNYFYFAMELANQEPKNDTLIKETLIKADTAFTYVGEKANNADAYLYLARVEYYLDEKDTEEKGVKAYDKFIEITTAKPEINARDKTNLVEAYSYNGGYFITRDKAKAKEYFDKALELDPNNAQIKDALRAIKG